MSNYRTSHQGIAAYFLLEGAFLIETGLDATNGRPYFVFNVPLHIGRKQAQAFFDGTTEVNASAYYLKISEIRSKIYELRRQTT